MPRKLKAQAGYRYALPALRRRRDELGLTAAELGRRVQMPKETLCRVERGKLRASRKRQHALARELERGVNDLFAPPEPLPTAERDAAIVKSYQELGSAEKAGRRHGLGKKAALAAIHRADVATRDRAREKQERLWAVAVLEEYRVPRMKFRKVLNAELGIEPSQSQLYLDLHELGYGERRPGDPKRQHVCENETCPRGGEPFTAYDAWRRGSRRERRFCSNECWQASPEMIRAIGAGHQKRWGLPAGRKVYGRHNRVLAAQKGNRVGDRTLAETDQDAVRAAAEFALGCYRRDPQIGRPDLVLLVTRQLEGRDAVFSSAARRRDSRDPVRRTAEKRVIRRLAAAAALPEFSETLLVRDFA